MWKELNGRKATYRALIVVANQVSNVELAENIEALVELHPTPREDRPAADLEKIQRFDGTPCHYKHNEGVFVLAS